MPALWLELAEHMVGAGLAMIQMGTQGLPGKILMTRIDVSVSWRGLEGAGLVLVVQVSKQLQEVVTGEL